MPYITDDNDFIEITPEQKEQVVDLYWEWFILKKLTHKEIEDRKEEIVPNSRGYKWVPRAPFPFLIGGMIMQPEDNRLYKQILI